MTPFCRQATRAASRVNRSRRLLASRIGRNLIPWFLDAGYDALSFFSEGGFRYFLPAYLIADLEDRLQTADPVFHLTNGFSDKVVDIPAGTTDR